MPEALIRQARLRPEHADSYPDIEPGVWTPAAGLARLVLDRGLYRRIPGAKGDRPLPEEHFEFRGPSLPPESRPGGRSRQTDVPVAQAERDLAASRGRLEDRLDAAEAGLDDAQKLERRFEDLERRDEELLRAAREPTELALPPEQPASVHPGRQGGPRPG
ncbi:MAG: hypothetical protein ACJ8DJ_09195 [Gemmatimonadales bacterium]